MRSGRAVVGCGAGSSAPSRLPASPRLSCVCAWFACVCAWIVSGLWSCLTVMRVLVARVTPSSLTCLLA